jgi:hypothetical protein
MSLASSVESRWEVGVKLVGEFPEVGFELGNIVH